MKKLLTTLILLAGVLIMSPEAAARDKKTNGNIASKENIKRKDSSKENKSSKSQHKMASENSDLKSGNKFVIDGHVALDIPDSCYRIYITDIDKEITESDYIATVPVKNKQFRFETNLNEMKAGRLRAVMPGGNLCSAWINIYFIPGFTVDMTVHNGYFDIDNESEYNFMTNAWINKEAMAALFERLGAPTRSDSDNKPNYEVRRDDLQSALLSYEYMLAQLKKQYQELIPRLGYNQQVQDLVERMNQINGKMEKMVDEYAKSLNF